VPAESRWHPPPATADADSGGEQVPVPEVMKVCEAEVMKTCEVVSWNVRAMTERMNAHRSAGHAKTLTVHAAHAVRAAHAVHAAHATHRLGRQCRWRGKHRHHDSASNSHFAEHDNPLGCHPVRHSENATERKMFK
jgi:hypothetical protein